MCQTRKSWPFEAWDAGRAKRRVRGGVAGAFIGVHLVLSVVAAFAQPVQPVSVTSVALSTGCPIAVGTSTTWTAAAVGGIAPLEYKFWLRNETTGTWTPLRDYATGASLPWTPPAPATYRLQVWVRSAGSVASYDSWRNGDACTATPAPPVVLSSLTSNPPSPGPAPVTWTAVATGGIPQLAFQFQVRNESTGSWTIQQDWGPLAQTVWTPPGAGTFTMRVYARSAFSTGTADAFRDAAFLVPVAGTTARVSVSTGGSGSDGSSNAFAINATGRYVAFDSFATNLVAADTNGFQDVFVRDRQQSVTTRVSLGPGGVQGDSDSHDPVLSADGRYVAFTSEATNLVSGDTNGVQDVFVRDRQNAVTTRVSIATSGTQANDDSVFPSISADGRFVAFQSAASNLVAGDSNGFSDVFVHDRLTGATTRVDVGAGGTEAMFGAYTPSISADGRWVAFMSNSPDLVVGDSNGAADIFVHDRQTGVTQRVSLTSGGEADGPSSAPSISADGRLVAFQSNATNLVPGDTNSMRDIFVRDRLTGLTTRVSESASGVQANGDSEAPSMSADGRVVVFQSYASNLVYGDANVAPDVFHRDLRTGAVQRVSVSSSGAEATLSSFLPSEGAAAGGDGRSVAFTSLDSTLVAGDVNGTGDIFVRQRAETTPPTVLLVSPELSAGAGGTVVTWTAYATGGTATLEYRFYLQDVGTGAWTMLRDYAASASVTWNPAPGTYVVQAWVRATGSPAPYEAFLNSALFTQAAPSAPALTGVTHDVSCPAAAGRWVTTTAAVTGGVQPVQYQFWLQSQNGGAWTMIQDYSSNNRVSWLPATPGTYVVQAWARSAGSVAASQTALNATACTITAPVPVATVALTSSASSPLNAGTFVVLTASATGGSAPLEYQFWIRNDIAGTWTQLQAYSRSNVAIWSAAAGSYTFQVWARSVGSSLAYDAWAPLQLLGVSASTGLASRTGSNQSGNDTSDRPAISADGRHVAFHSIASDLVAGDSNATWDVFVYDRQGGTTTRASVTSGGSQASGMSYAPSISADGRVVAFVSQAFDLIANDTNNTADVFLRDLVGLATVRVSLTNTGGQANGPSVAPSINADGRMVAFSSTASNLVAGDTNGQPDVFVRDRQASTTTRVSVATGGTEANGPSYAPSISADGRFVAFASDASNLVAGDTNGVTDVFVRDLLAGTTTRVSVANNGAQSTAPSDTASISADGRRVAFDSFASTLVAGDTNGTWDVFIRDLLASTTTRASVSSSGVEGGGASWAPSLSADGRRVAFQSAAANFWDTDFNGTWDVFVRDLGAGLTRPLTLTPNGASASGASFGPALDGDGRLSAFGSSATTLLVLPDANGRDDVYWHDDGVAGPASVLLVSYDGAKWTIYGAGGSAALDYKFQLNTNGTWTVLRDWGSTNTANWTPPVPGSYYVQGWVRTSGSSANIPEAALNSATVVVP